MITKALVLYSFFDFSITGHFSLRFCFLDLWHGYSTWHREPGVRPLVQFTNTLFCFVFYRTRLLVCDILPASKQRERSQGLFRV